MCVALIENVVLIAITLLWYIFTLLFINKLITVVKSLIFLLLHKGESKNKRAHGISKFKIWRYKELAQRIQVLFDSLQKYDFYVFLIIWYNIWWHNSFCFLVTYLIFFIFKLLYFFLSFRSLCNFAMLHKGFSVSKTQ